MLFFCLYALALLTAGLIEARRERGAASFFVNGRRSGPWQTGFSLLGAAVGGSATVGVAGLAWQVGVPAFWWMGSLWRIWLLWIWGIFWKARRTEAEIISQHPVSGCCGTVRSC